MEVLKMKKITIKPFNSLCKKIAKTDTLYLQDADGMVYICDGHFIVAVSRNFYDDCIKPELVFDVPENSRVTITKNIVSETSESAFKIKDIFENKPELVPTQMTSVLIDRPYGNNDGYCRIFKTKDGRFTAIDKKFVDALLFFGFANVKANKEKPEKAPLWTDDFMICPVNMDAKTILENMVN